MKTESNLLRRINASIILIIILMLMLTVSTFALVSSIADIRNNIINTGEVKINLNNGEPVIDYRDNIYEPGATLKSEFFLENMSSDSVYYKLYFENIKGNLADAVLVTIKDEDDNILVEDIMSNITEKNTLAYQSELKVLEKKNYIILFHFMENSRNEYQGSILNFNLTAKATQTRNNSLRLFD